MSERRSVAVRFWVATLGLSLLTAGCGGAQAGSATASAAPTSTAAKTAAVLIPSQAIEPGATAVREPNTPATPTGPSTPAVTTLPATPTPAQSAPEPTAAPSTAVVTVTETAGSPAADLGAASTQDLNLPPAIEPGASGFSSFQSPSGNIFCLILADPGSAWVRCDISDFTYAAPTQDCGPDVGFHAGSASIEGLAAASIGGCFGDTVADPSYPVLAYGQRAVGGDISCTSTESGMTCQNLASGYGFRLAKATYELF